MGRNSCFILNIMQIIYIMLKLKKKHVAMLAYMRESINFAVSYVENKIWCSTFAQRQIPKRYN